jgi:hypothetical protein
MDKNTLPPQGVLRQLLRYDPKTGQLFWRKRSPDMFANGKQPARHNAAIWNAKNAGCEAFTTALPSGYRYSTIQRQKMYAHRVIWKMAFGAEPREIDHINGNPADNRLCNLREVSHAANGRNLKRSRANSSGVTGVCYDAGRRKWRARICVNYRNQFLGSFDGFGEAVEARKAAEAKYDFHENHGRHR